MSETRRKPWRVPKRVSIKGINYKVLIVEKLKDDDGDFCDGLHDHSKKVIYIDKSTKGATRRKTFLHEMFHAYIYECNIREGLQETLEEVIVETMAQATDEQFFLEWKK